MTATETVATTLKVLAVYGAAQDGPPIGQDQDVGQEQRRDDAVQYLGVDDQRNQVAAYQRHSRADGDLQGEKTIKQWGLPEAGGDRTGLADSVCDGVRG